MTEIVQHLGLGFSIALEPINLLYAFLRLSGGDTDRCPAGDRAGRRMALLIPLIYGKSPASAVILLAGIYYGAMYGGSTTSILLNLPGEAASVVTTLDGYQMAKQGRAGPALCIAAIGSFVAGTLSVAFLMLIGPPLARFALQFGPAESFALMVFGLTTVSSLAGNSLLKGTISTVFGLMLATMGIDLPTGLQRYTFGVDKLMEGFDIIVAAIGLFAIPEILMALEEISAGTLEQLKVSRIWLSARDFLNSVGAILRGTVLGFLVGAVPGAAHVTASFFSYALEKKLSPHPERFGKGEIRGVAGPESANNAAASGALLPLLTLGLPASTVTAVLYGALLMVGVKPSPFLFQRHPDVIWGLVASMYVGNVMLLILNLPAGRNLRPDPQHSRALVVPDCSGDLLRRRLQRPQFGTRPGHGHDPGGDRVPDAEIRLPAGPSDLGAGSGDLLEQSLRQALMISGGEVGILYQSAISKALFLLAVTVVFAPALLKRLRG